jgi:hypothetical protein
MGFKGAYSLVSLAGFIYSIVGYAQARLAPVAAVDAATRHGARHSRT